MYKQVLDPVSHSLGTSSIFAVLPLLSLFVLLGGVRMKAQWASLISLAVAVVVAIAVYGMPFGQALDAGAEGAAFGFFPIMWIVINALWIFNMTVETGDFAVLRRAFSSVSNDQRVQVVMIAFCFGALLEALAGFGTPVAICGVMLVGLGFRPIKAVARGIGGRHRARRLRGDRHPDHHAGPGHRTAQARPQPNGRTSGSLPGVPGALPAGVH